MNIESKIWRRRNPDAAIVNTLSEDLGITRISSQILANRGLKTTEDAERFLNPNIEDLHDSFLLKGMTEAVERIHTAIKRKESIWIYGDYDVDGITSISVMLKTFSALGYPVKHYIPNRLIEGYGISQTGVDFIHNAGGGLIISVDCGITANKEVDYAKGLGIDFIISDHHECQEDVPEAIAVINPKQKDCKYPFDMLAGVGVAFKLCQAIYPDLMEQAELLQELLNITALGTVADIAPVNGENRILVKHGMKNMSNTPNIGLLKLIEASGIKGKKMTTGHIGFRLGPRINATGRVGEPGLGVDLFMTNSATEAERISTQLGELNDERQQIERDILAEAIELIESDPSYLDDRVLVVAKEGWHTGIVGIVASKICERYYKPVILLRIEEGIAKGSARSIPEFSIFDGLAYSKSFLEGFGGHELAAGMSLKADQVQNLRESINQYAQDHLTEFDLIPKIKLDSSLESKDVNYQLLDDIEKMEPFGIGNAKPVFAYHNLILDQKRTMGKNKEHIKLITHDGNRVFESVGFYMDMPANLNVGTRVDLAFQVDRNEFNGVTSLQFLLKDYRLKDNAISQQTSYIHKYYDSLVHALKDDLPETENPLPIFIDFRNQLGKEKIVNNLVDEDRHSLILIHTAEGMLDIMRLALDYNRPDWLEGMKYNICPEHKNTNPVILINPEYSSLPDDMYDQIIVYDIPYSKNHFNYLMNLCKNTTVLYNKNDDHNMATTLNNTIPDRNDLANIYKAIKLQTFASEFSDEKVLMNMKPKRDMGLYVLETLDLIMLNETTKAYEIVPQGNKKTDLFNTDVYSKIQNIKYKYESFQKDAHQKVYK